MRDEFFFQHAVGMDEQRAVNRLVRHAPTVMVAKFPGKPGRDLLRRPVQTQLLGDQQGQRRLLRQAAGLGTLRTAPSLPISNEGSIARLAAFEVTGQPYSGDDHRRTAGNGSLMRLAPVVLYCYPDMSRLSALCADSSRTTHSAPEAVEFCVLLGHRLASAL